MGQLAYSKTLKVTEPNSPGCIMEEILYRSIVMMYAKRKWKADHCMMKAKHGDTVSIQFVGTLEDGTIVDSSAIGVGKQAPLQFTIGEHAVKRRVEYAVVGMKPGETRTLCIPASQAFGAYDDDLVVELATETLPDDAEPQEGQRMFTQEEGQLAFATVLEVDGSNVKVDANPPLAGKDLRYEIKLIKIL